MSCGVWAWELRERLGSGESELWEDSSQKVENWEPERTFDQRDDRQTHNDTPWTPDGAENNQKHFFWEI